MTNLEQLRAEYDKAASRYNDFGSLPSGQLESELIKLALGDCTGLTVLDLGGGTGTHAREAIDLGAASVDILDISPGMLKQGQEIEESLGRQDVIRFLEADVSKPLLHIPLHKNGYDLVMANWIFDHAETMEVLEGMFHNIVGYLKPGGRFVGVRDANPKSPAVLTKYGGSCTWIKDIPGGVKYGFKIHTEPPMEFEAASLEVIYSGSTEMYEKFGLTNIDLVPHESAEVVRKDPEFWQAFLEQPYFAVVKAVKK